MKSTFFSRRVTLSWLSLDSESVSIDGKRWETNYKDSEAHFASFAATRRCRATHASERSPARVCWKSEWAGAEAQTSEAGEIRQRRYKTRQGLRHPGQRHHFVPVRQETSSDCESEEEECANMALVKQAALLWINYRAINTQFCDNMQYGGWSKSQSANEDEVLFSSLTAMCLADDDLIGSQLSPGTQKSLLRD
jgi:hypothetical protein